VSPRAIGSLVAAAIVAAGCANPGPETERRSLREPATLAAGRTLAGVTLSEAGWPAADWWRALDDPALDALIAQALEGSPGLAVAQSRLARAQAIALATRSALGPEVVGSGESVTQLYSQAGLIPPPVGGSWRSQNRLAVDVTWDLDVWGRNQATFESALGQAKAAEIDVAATRLALTTAIARGWVELARLHELAELARATLAQRTRLLAVTTRRVEAGLDSQVDLQQVAAGVPAARLDVAAFEEAIALAGHQLAALSGQGPDRAAAFERPRLTAARALALPSALPADLLGRRPDLVGQRWRVESAGRDIDAARARFYPNVNLIGFVGLSSVGLSQFFSSAAAIAGVGPAVRLPLFDGGRLRGELATRRADYDIAVEQYNQALVEALREVADQVATLRTFATRRADQAEALAAYRKAHALAALRYERGLGNLLAVLTTEGQVIAQSRVDAELRARELDTGVVLVRALGGGFMPEPPPAAAAAR